jgi:hypothetical protein
MNAEVDDPIEKKLGPQFISHAFEAACERFPIGYERIPARPPNRNSHIEAFHRLLEEECLGKVFLTAMKRPIKL